MKQILYILFSFIYLMIFPEDIAGDPESISSANEKQDIRFFEQINNDTLYFDQVIYDNSLLILSREKVLSDSNHFTFNNGRIIFNGIYDSVTIYFKHIPVQIKYKNSLYDINEAESDSINKTEQVLNENVYVGGIKGFNVSVNNNGSVAFNQSLEMNVEGKIDDKWNISGYIYDDGIASSMNTYNIPVSQIENVNLSLYDSFNMISLGNNKFNGFSGRFTQRERNILGLYAETRIADMDISGAIAGQKGKYKEIEFFCTDNVQGPYKLVNQVLLLDYIITPGTDKVYVNGILMENGDNADYTLNYQTGELIFSPAVDVDASTHVYAQFQTYEESSSLTGYYGTFSYGDSLFNFMLMREEQTLNSETEKEFFSSFNSDSSYAFVSSAEYVGANEGDYVLEDSFFVYSGYKEGDYRVSFFYVGINNGDYIYSPMINAYVYAGKNLGNYNAGRYLQMPYESNYLAGDFYYNYNKFYISLSSGGGFYKRNKYAVNSSYENDIAYTGEFGFKNIELADIMYSAYYSRVYMPELYNAVWKNSQTSDIMLESENKNYTDFNSADNYALNISYLHFNGDFKYSIYDSMIQRSLNVKVDSIFGFSITGMKRMNTFNDLISYNNESVKIERTFWEITPHYSFTRETKNNIKYIRHNAGLNVFKNTQISAVNEYSTGALERQIKLINLKTLLRIGLYDISGNIQYKRIEPDSGAYNDNVLMRAIMSGAVFSWWNIRAYINSTSLSQFKIQEQYIYAGKGKGDFVYDSLSMNYIFDEYEGEYIKVEESVLSNIPQASRDLTLNSDIFKSGFRMNSEFRYKDNVPSIGTFNRGEINSSDIYMYNSTGLQIKKDINIYINNQYSFSDLYSNNLYSYSRNSLGMTKTMKELIYEISADINHELNSNTLGSTQEFNDYVLKNELQLIRSKMQYRVGLTVGYTKGLYDDAYTDSLKFDIKRNLIMFSVKYYFIKSLSLQVKPQISFNQYNTINAVPIALNYKYPEGPSGNITATLSYNNEFISINAVYSSEYTGLLGFRQKAEVSLYSYF